MIDFGATADDYAVYRRPFARELYARLARFGIGIAGQRVLDLAAGTGLLGRPLAEAGCGVTAVDVSVELLARARGRDASASCVAHPLSEGSGDKERRASSGPSPQPSPLSTGERVHEVASAAATVPMRYAAARAERLPFADGSFDAVVAGQCWHWFDRTTAPAEIRRALVAGGKVAAVYQTHIPLPGSVAEATEHLLLRYRPSWRHANSTGINGQVLRDLQSHGFEDIESFSFDIAEPFTRDDWRGLARTWSAAGASLSAERLAEFDRDHAKLLGEWPEPMRVPHRVFAAIATKPAKPQAEEG